MLDHTFTLVSVMMSTLTHLNQGVRITPFWTKQSKTLSMVLILSPWPLLRQHELDAFFDKADAMPSSVSSVFLHLIHTISDNS